MKTIITKNVCVSEDDIAIHDYPGIFAIELRNGMVKQIQIDYKKLDLLIKLLQVFKEQKEAEYTLKDILIRDDKEQSKST